MIQLAIQLFAWICHGFEVVFVKYTKHAWKPLAPGGTIIFSMKMSAGEFKLITVYCLSSYSVF